MQWSSGEDSDDLHIKPNKESEATDQNRNCKSVSNFSDFISLACLLVCPPLCSPIETTSKSLELKMDGMPVFRTCKEKWETL